MDTVLSTPEDLRRWRRCVRAFVEETPSVPLARPSPAQDPTLAAVLRSTFPGAAHVAPGLDWEAAAAATHTLLTSPALQTEGAALFGATFVADDGSATRLDVLQRGPAGWRVIKVRLATAGDDADVDEVAWGVHVASRCGLRIQHAVLQLVDTDFVYPGFGLYAGLLREVDLLPVLGTRPVAQWLVAMRRARREPAPAACPGTCTGTARCDPAPVDRPDTTVPLEALGRETAMRLRDAGHTCLREVPLEAVTEPRHRRILVAVQEDRAVVEPSLAPRLAALPGPRRYLRIDTIGFAVPVWPGTKPYEVLPFQWTCLREDAEGRGHTSAFLAEGRGDPRRAFTTTLIEAMGEQGAVLAYNAGFERNRLRELARAFHDLAPALDALQQRIVDVFQLLREHAYHPAMAGSWSFRSACRAWAGQVDVPPFEAAEAFARCWLGGDRVALQAALRAHGQQETLALQAIVQALASPEWIARIPHDSATAP